MIYFGTEAKLHAHRAVRRLQRRSHAVRLRIRRVQSPKTRAALQFGGEISPLRSQDAHLPQNKAYNQSGMKRGRNGSQR